MMRASRVIREQLRQAFQNSHRSRFDTQPELRVRVLRGADIATLCCDGIATSTNAGLVGNANPSFWRFVGRENADGAVHRAAGPELQAACDEQRTLDGGAPARLGGAIVTPAFGRLRARAVIHAFAPDGAYALGLQSWQGRRQWSGDRGARGVYLAEARPAGEADALLRSAYASVLDAAAARRLRTVAMPALGCGVHKFRADRAAKLALRAIAAHAERDEGGVERVDFALYTDEVYDAWSECARAAFGAPASASPEEEVFDLRARKEPRRPRGDPRVHAPSNGAVAT